MITISIQEWNEAYTQATFINGLQFIGIVFIIFFSMFVGSSALFKNSNAQSSFAIVSTTVVLLVTIVVCGSIQEERRTKWKEEVEDKLIEQLDVHKVDISDYFKVDEPTLITKGFFTKDNVKNKVDFKLFWIEDGVPVENNITVELVKVPNLKQAYLEYQYLEERLPEKKRTQGTFGKDTVFAKGYYNAVLHIPEHIE